MTTAHAKSIAPQAVPFCPPEDRAYREESSEDHPERGNWTGKLDFLMSMLAYCIGLGNVWRFPYLCFKNGGGFATYGYKNSCTVMRTTMSCFSGLGFYRMFIYCGAFLIPYAICWISCAVPCFFLEVSMGQYLQRGGIGLWDVCPLFRGVGLASMVMSTYSNIYYCVIVAWAMFYFLSSFATELPWLHCGHWWNNEFCRESNTTSNTTYDIVDNSSFTSLATLTNGMSNGTNISYQNPVEQFWLYRVLHSSESIDTGPELVWELVLLLLLVWVLSYFALWKGITKIKKVIYVCAITPYILLFILLIRAATLPGAMNGIYFYLRPNMSKLAETTVWKDAGTQVFYSYGIGFGVITAIGSYNKFNHNCLKEFISRVFRDTFIICVANGCTSLLAGFVVFSVLGYMSYIFDLPVDKVAASGPGLVFQAYPEVVATLQVPQFWSALFFLMIIILGLDSQVCNIEGVVTGFSDVFPNTLRRYKERFVLGLCAVCFLLGLPFVTRAGRYWLTIMDAFGASGFTLLIIVFTELMGFTYGYGLSNLYKSLHDMLGFKPWPVWLYLWKYITPLTVGILFLFITIMYEPLESPGGKVFDGWVQVLGLLITCSSIVFIPTWAIYCVARQDGNGFKQKLRLALQPKRNTLKSEAPTSSQGIIQNVDASNQKLVESPLEM